MFNDSKYTRWYFKIISKYGNVNCDIFEKHHVIPRSCGGTDCAENLVKLDPRVHFIAHHLLTKMMLCAEHSRKMKYAFWRMLNPQTRKHSRSSIRITSVVYARYKAHQKQQMRGENNPMRRPNVVALFIGRRRPEQSAVASLRNKKYWETRAKPILTLQCKTCGTNFNSKNSNQPCCSRSCASSYRNKMRHLGNKVCP